MSKPRILVTNLMMLKERDRFDAALRDLGADPVWATVQQYLDEDACLAYAGTVDAWAAGDDRVTRRVLEGFLPRLRGIAKWGTGVDSFDLAAARDLGIPVRNTPGAFSEAVSEVAIGYMLMLTRHLASIDRAIRAGGWPKPAGLGLYGRTLGMIGYGAIGQGVGRRATGFGMEILAHDPPMAHLGRHANADLVDLDTLIERSDVVCIACNYTGENRHLINAERLAKMKPDAILVNVARGPIVDEAALAAALAAGQIAGAGLDVFEEEPLPASSPLRAMDNVVLGSHNANNLKSAVEFVHTNTMQNLKEMIAPLL